MAAAAKPLDVLRAFIADERDRFVTRDNNLFSTAFSDLVRYRRFLQRIEGRHMLISQEFVASAQAMLARLTESSGPRPMTAVDMAVLDAREELGLALQLEIESFYLFAKILLDEVARAIEFYFGPVPKLALDSHDDLTKRIERYAAQHQVTLPTGFTKRAEQLKSDVSDYRDQQIAHHKNPRTIRGIGYNQEGTTRMVLSPLYPKESDKQAETRALHELLVDIDGYLLSIVDFLRANSERTRLEVEPKPERLGGGPLSESPPRAPSRL
jgi:hypothetical protein